MLHIFNKSPFEKNSFASCVAHAADGSAFLLIEDGVYAAIKGSSVADALGKAMTMGKVYALKSDVASRGIQAKLADGIEQVDYAGFVDLVTTNDRVQSWL